MQLTTKHLTKRYKNKLALDHVNMDAGPGIYGILGPNGSGKTTFLRMLVDTLEPSEGAVYLDDVPIKSLQENYRDKLGYLPQNFGYYPEFSAYRFLMYIASCKGMSKKEGHSATLHWLKEMRLLDVKDKKIRTFSGGMKQRLGIAQAMLNDPSIIIMDEPTAGLDVQERIRFKEIINKLAKDRIILISTHIVSDIESIADCILVIRQGQLLYQKQPEECLSLLQNKVWEFDCLEEELDTSNYIPHSLKTSGSSIHVRCISDTQPHPSAYTVDANLEDFYLFVFQESAYENTSEV